MLYNKIYLIDDESYSLELTQSLLNQCYDGLTIVVFLNPEMGMDYILEKEHNHRTLIFLDLNMPIMSGWDFLSSIKEKWSTKQFEKIDICILSSSEDQENIMRAEANEMVLHYAIKPNDKAGMKKIMETLELKITNQ